uniref:F-box domain-containing protein n=1 Tax=Mycena chlorophos TaxID=658473 RepID=A0ABQ0MCU5_MYCCL|nr:predicted protein [Mycena chlorophos]
MLSGSALQTVLELEASIAALQARRDDILAAHGAIPPTMNNLAAELLVEIFFQYIQMENICDGPLQMALVCRRWRDIVLATPRLWTNLRLDFKDTWTGFPAMLRSFLSRAGSLPINIYMPFLRDPPLLVQHAHRLSSLDFVVGAFRDLVELNDAADGFPALHSLRVRVKYNTVESDDGLIITAFRNTPLLCDAHVDITTWGDDFEDLTEVIQLPIPQLRHWTLRARFTLESLDTLSKATNLLSLDLDIHWRDADDAPSVQSRINLPRLRKLRINVGDLRLVDAPLLETLELIEHNYALPIPEGTTFVYPSLLDLTVPHLGRLSFFETPCLTKLRVVGSYEILSQIDNILGLIARSGGPAVCAIKTLDFTTSNVNDATAILFALPSLTEFTLRAGVWSAGAMDRLFDWLSTPSSDILPRLTAIRLETSPIHPASIRSVARMLRARRCAPGGQWAAKLQTFSFRSWGEPRALTEDRTAVEQIRNLRAAGLEFDLGAMPLFDEKLTESLVYHILPFSMVSDPVIGAAAQNLTRSVKCVVK